MFPLLLNSPLFLQGHHTGAGHRPATAEHCHSRSPTAAGGLPRHYSQGLSWRALSQQLFAYLSSSLFSHPEELILLWECIKVCQCFSSGLENGHFLRFGCLFSCSMGVCLKSHCFELLRNSCLLFLRKSGTPTPRDSAEKPWRGSPTPAAPPPWSFPTSGRSSTTSVAPRVVLKGRGSFFC